MGEKNFDFDKFNEVLQKSSAICAQGRKDIATAIAAGKGVPARPTAKVGQVWKLVGDMSPILLLPPHPSDRDEGAMCLLLNKSGLGACYILGLSHIDNSQGATLVAESLNEFIAKGGKF